jgi:hypothetical protein
MKTILHYLTCALFTLFFGSAHLLFAQCGSNVVNGTSTNLFTHIRNATNPVAADKNLNTIIFVHRNNAGAFGGNSGHLRYDISTNAGTSWTNDLGFLNPVNSSLGRYPNAIIHNPVNNTIPASAYLGYMAATISTVNSTWNGVVTGVRQLNGAGNTETYNQPVVAPQLIPQSMVKGAPGVYWAIDALFNGTNITGFVVYKGQWNANTNDIVWAFNYSVTPNFNTGFSNIPQVGDYHIGFDPTGTNGWISFLSHVSPGPANYAYYPVLYKTTNGGQTWTGPIQVNLNQFSCMTANTGTNVVTANFEHDLVVDALGNPHILTTICNGNNGYSVFYTSWHHMFDITQRNGIWVAYDLANVLAGRGSWGTSPNIISMDMAPQAARSADGTKLFFTWSDNSGYSLGTANNSPNMFGKALNISNWNWTPVKDFSSCNAAVAGKIIVPHVAPEVLEPSANVFKLAPVYGEMPLNDPALQANFNFLNNVTFSSTEFSLSTPSATMALQQGNPVLLCPGTTININPSAPVGDIVWSTGSTATAIAISSGSINTYSLIAQQGCLLGTLSIGITNMSVSASAPTVAVCPGQTLALTALGNAQTYSWMPGALSGTSAVITASSTAIYSLIAGSNAGCTITQTLAINLQPTPTLNVLGGTTLCVGSVLNATVTGAANYSWSTGATGSVVALSPTVNTSYSIAATSSANCAASIPFSIQVLPSPTVTASADKTVICFGQTVALTAAGALSYTWSNGSTNNPITVTPSVSATFTVIGENSFGCAKSSSIALTVNPLPTVQIVTTRTAICKGEKQVLNASGASSYTWNTGSTTSSLQVNPLTTTAYTLYGIDAQNCNGQASIIIQVNDCLGLSNLESSLLFYPNPASQHLFVKGIQLKGITMYDISGKCVLQVNCNADNVEVSTAELPEGVYSVKINSTLGVFTRRISILHP